LEELVSPAERALKLALGEPSFSVYQMVEASFSHHWHAARSRVLECLEDLSPGLERAAGALWAASLLDPAARRELVDLATATLGPAPHDDNLVECTPAGLRSLKPITQRAEVEKLDEMLRFHRPFGGSVVARAEHVLGFSRALGPAEQSSVANAVFEYARCLGDPKRIDVGLLAIVAMKASDRAIAARELLAWANAVVDDPYGKAVALAAAACADPAESFHLARVALDLANGLEQWQRANVATWLTAHRSPGVAEVVLDVAEELPEPFRASVLEVALLRRPPTGWERILQLIDSIADREMRCILLQRASAWPGNPVRLECVKRAVSIVAELDPRTVGSDLVEHVRQLLFVSDPEQAISVLEVGWKAFSQLSRHQHATELLRVSQTAARIHPSLCSLLASNLDQVARWWP
jgi:hypothetical protein